MSALTERERLRLAELEAVAKLLKVDPAAIDMRLTDRRQEWQLDGADARKNADQGDATVLAIMVQHIAGGHAGCRRRDCGTCPPLRRAVAYVLARSRHAAERAG